jgi:phage FluMu gp28-like protein
MTKLDAIVTPEMRVLADEADYHFERRVPAVLLPYQQRWMADTSKVKIAEKSRRVGLTWAEASDAALFASTTNGDDVWYIGYNKDMAIEFILDVAQWAAHFSQAVDAIECGEEIFENGDDRKSVLTFSIRFASGHRVTALSSRPSNLRGKQGRVIIDEAAFHPDLKELLKAAFALTIWGGQIRVISTHNGVDNAFNEAILESRAGRKPYKVHFIDFKLAIAEGLCRRVFAKLGIPWNERAELDWEEEIRSIYRPNDSEELDCIPSQSGGSYFSRALVESRMSERFPVLRLTCAEGFELRAPEVRETTVSDWLERYVKPLLTALPRNLTSFYGMDFARSGDLSSITPLVENNLLMKANPFIVEMRNVPFEQQKQVLFYVVDGLPNFSSGANDARGNGQWLAEVAAQKYGAEYIHRVMLTQEWYRDNMPKYKAAFEDAEILLPKDEGVLSDHRAVMIVNGVPKVPDTGHTKDKTDGGQRHGDTAVSGALAWFASLNGASPIEFESDGADRDRDMEGFLYG